MMNKRYFFIFLIYFFLSGSLCEANNLLVQNVSLEGRRLSAIGGNPIVLVEFDVSWDNSWRNTENYDAAWLVFKGSVGGGTLTHCTVTNGLFGSRYNIGDTVGSNSNLEFYYPTDGGGVFLQRKVSGTGTASTTNARITVYCGADATQTLSIKVIGIEMVYIPQGTFRAGDGRSYAGFIGGTFTTPWHIASEASINTAGNPVGPRYYVSAGNSGEFASGSVFTVPDEFPKGFAAFYVMKYPVTEGQWVEFVNNISDTAKVNRDITGTGGKKSDSVVKRNTISWPGTGNASTTREDRAMSYLSWMDLAAYLDWVALRPLTELEYEKIARGPVSTVQGEYAWGNTNLTAGMTFAGSPEDGNETFISANAANAIYNSTTFSEGDSYLGAEYQQGPVRPGIFAATSATRQRSGAGYYGVMDLSGNLFERAVTVGNTTGITYYPVHGDGSINTLSGYEGNARQLGWPGTDAIGTRGVTGATGIGVRGGSWESLWGLLRVSDRSYAAFTHTARDNRGGGRGARSISLTSYPRCGDGSLSPPEQCEALLDPACSANCEKTK